MSYGEKNELLKYSLHYARKRVVKMNRFLFVFVDNFLYIRHVIIPSLLCVTLYYTEQVKKGIVVQKSVKRRKMSLQPFYKSMKENKKETTLKFLIVVYFTRLSRRTVLLFSKKKGKTKRAKLLLVIASPYNSWPYLWRLTLSSFELA